MIMMLFILPLLLNPLDLLAEDLKLMNESNFDQVDSLQTRADGVYISKNNPVKLVPSIE